MMFSNRKTIRQALLNGANTKVSESELQKQFLLSENSAPWYVHLFLILGSWLGTVLIAVFIGWRLRSTEAATYFILGIVLSIGAVLIYHAAKNSNFVKHLAIPVSLLGVMSLLFGFDKFGFSERSIALVIIVAEAAVFIVNSDPVRRFICTLSIPIATGFLIYSKTSLYPYQLIFILQLGIGVLLWENQAKVLASKLASSLQPAMYGLLTGLLVLLLFTVYREKSSYRVVFDFNQWWLTTSAVAIAFLYVIRNALQKLNSANINFAIFGSVLVILIALLTYHSPGVLAALLVLVIAYSQGSRILFGIACAFLVFYLSAYYYNLSISLLQKSISLMASGIFILLAAWIMNRLTPSEDV